MPTFPRPIRDPRRHRARQVLLAAAVGSVVVAPLAAQTPFDDRDARYSFAGVQFPAVADTFAVMRVTRWPDASLGVMLGYMTPLEGSPNFDVYVYPASDPRGGLSVEKWLEQEFDDALDDIRRFGAGRQGVDVEVERRDTLRVVAADGREYTGWVAETLFSGGSGSRRSLLYVFEKDGWFVKYRMTYDPAHRDVVDPRIDAFIAETLAGVEGT